MTIRVWSLFYDWVLPDLKGSPATSLVDHACREMSRAFCANTHAHKEDIPSINVVAGTANYAIVTSDPANLDVDRVLTAWYSGVEIEQKATDDLVDLYGTRWQEKTGTPLYFTQIDSGSVILVPAPDTSLTAGLKMSVSLMPTLAATGLADVIFDNWIDDIAKGIKAKFMLQDKKPWTNTELGMAYMAAFDGTVDSVRMLAQKAFGRARVRTRSRFF